MQSQGLHQGHIIAIASTKIFEDYALMIACLKIGVSYANIDIDNPPERINHIFQICQPKIIFSSVELKNIQTVNKKNNVTFHGYDKITTSKVPNEIDFDGETVAYIMFTSGSTGIPKGIAITHQNLIHFIQWTTSRYHISPLDNFANISPMYFDNSVFDFYTALFSGASLTPIFKPLLTQPLDLIQYIDQKKCTIWFSVPSMLIYLLTMKVLNKSNLKDIRVFIFGGEGFPKTELKKLFDIYSDRTDIINVYGPTECTCICSSYKITEKDFDNLEELPPLGTINPNFSYIILDNDMYNSQGELCLLGPNISKGYYNDPKQTQKAFSFHSDERHYLKAMYRTGDWVEEKNGLLYFKGRIDNQIKHMGYRIELEEIEGSLNSLPEIKQSAVLYKRVSTTFGKIIAFFIPETDNFKALSVKKKLKKKLPAYMIPMDYYPLDTLPKNANGKIDKKRLEEKLDLLY